MAKDVVNSENVIGEKSFFQGKFRLKGNLRIEGKYEGDSLLVDTVVVGKTGKVKTHIEANHVIVEGIVIGSIKAQVRVMLYPSAKILGDITTPELIIQNGVIFEGKCRITNQQDEAADTMIENLYNS